MGTLRAEAPQFLMVLDLNENKRFLKQSIACQSFTLNVLSLLVIVLRRVVYNYKKWSSLFPETAHSCQWAAGIGRCPALHLLYQIKINKHCAKEPTRFKPTTRLLGIAYCLSCNSRHSLYSRVALFMKLKGSCHVVHAVRTMGSMK